MTRVYVKRRGFSDQGVAMTIILCVQLMAGGCNDNTTPADYSSPCPPASAPPPLPYDSPVWHPSGMFIGFNHTPARHIEYPNGEQCEGVFTFAADSSGFWLIDADGTNLRLILRERLEEPAWSPDGGWIAFVRRNPTSHIWIMQFTGGGFDTATAMRLTSEGENGRPSWSPDGSRIAFESTRQDPHDARFLWIMDRNGAGMTDISPHDAGEWRMPSWTADGAHIVFRRTLPGGTVDLFSVDTAGGNLIRLTGDSRVEAAPVCAPVSDAMVFASRLATGVQYDLIAGRSGSPFPPVTLFEGVDEEGGVSWSPDGAFVCLTAYRTNDWSARNGVLWVVRVSTVQPRQLTFNTPQ